MFIKKAVSRKFFSLSIFPQRTKKRATPPRGGSKVVTIETGARVAVPLFINAGDVIRINTGTEEYAERVSGRK